MVSSATIRVMSAEEIAARAGGETPFLHWPQRGTLFAERAMRLRQLARGHPMGDYLEFAARIALAQQAALDGCPEPPVPDAAALARARASGAPPLRATDWPRAPQWRELARAIATALQANAAPATRGVLERVLQAGDDALEAQADALLERTPTGLDYGAAPIVAAALQVHWTRTLLATRERTGSIGEPIVRLPDEAACPACGSPPVASITRSGGESLGQRYLHCALCSLQWHLPRSKCPHCLGPEGLAFQSLDVADAADGDSRAAQAAVQAETCEACGHYLKIVHTDRDPQVDPVADDLASVTLDLLVAETGRLRHGLNYLLLFGEPPDPPPESA